MIQRLKGGGPAPPSSDQTLPLTADSGSASPTLLGDELGCLLTTAGARPPLTGGEHLQGCWLPFQRQTVRLTGPHRDKTGVASPPRSSGVNRPRKPAARLVLRVPLHRWGFFFSLSSLLFIPSKNLLSCGFLANVLRGTPGRWRFSLDSRRCTQAPACGIREIHTRW